MAKTYSALDCGVWSKGGIIGVPKECEAGSVWPSHKGSDVADALVDEVAGETIESDEVVEAFDPLRNR